MIDLLQGGIRIIARVQRLVWVPTMLMLLFKVTRIVLVISAIKLVALSYQSGELSIKLLFTIVALAISFLFIKIFRRKSINSIAAQLALNDLKAEAKLKKTLENISSYSGSLALVLIMLVVFVYINALFVIAWILGVILFVLLRLHDYPEIGMVLSLLCLTMLILLIPSSQEPSLLISFVLLVLAFRYWFSDTVRVIKQPQRFMSQSRELMGFVRQS